MGILDPKRYDDEDDNKWSRDRSSECSSCIERDTCNRYGSGNCSHYCYDM